ncbi:MAG: hypothetical protein WC523_00545 [Patescibacteria group bacterium]
MFIDREGEHNIRCPIPHPHAGVGGGIFVGIKKNTRVLIAMAPQEQAYIVSVVPERSYYFSQSGVLDSSVDTSSYPDVSSGEIYLKGPLNSAIYFSKNGNIAFESGAGELETDLELSKFSKALFLRTNNIYRFTEAGRNIEGVIRRDKSEYEDPNDTSTVNFLSGEAYDSLLADIGRLSEQEVSLRSNQISKLTIRNPALVEKRNLTYEFADSFGVRDLKNESEASTLVRENNTDQPNISTDPSFRENRRTDILDLNPRNFNHLIEKVEGTVVDIYGNILDINRNKIQIPDNDFNTGNNSSQSLRRMYSYLRRSIKYHYEINSRKESSDVDFSTEKVSNNAKEHSRWSVDVDGEGLTKINIPASSETGNIPVLGRYVVSRNPDKNLANQGQFKDPEQKDVRILPFGPATGVVVDDSNYIPASIKNPVSVGTAHHNILEIAPSVFNGNRIGPINTHINNKILDLQTDDNGIKNYHTNSDANAGGRSLNLNLDGSAEISIGADTSDRKSLVLDLAGGLVSHYGRDKNGRSIIHQTDGDVIIQIGGAGIGTDERFTSSEDKEDRPGRIEIHLNRPTGDSHRIIIDENGMQIDIKGNVVMSSSGDFSIIAGADLLLDGRNINMYGTADSEGLRNITATEKTISRNGRNTP